MTEHPSGRDTAGEAGDPGLKEDAIGAETVDPEVAAGRKLGVAAVPEEAV
jgi:hypothetical protein